MGMLVTGRVFTPRAVMTRAQSAQGKMKIDYARPMYSDHPILKVKPQKVHRGIAMGVWVNPKASLKAKIQLDKKNHVVTVQLKAHLSKPNDLGAELREFYVPGRLPGSIGDNDTKYALVVKDGNGDVLLRRAASFFPA
jgi:hypothetical protein